MAKVSYEELPEVEAALVRIAARFGVKRAHVVRWATSQFAREHDPAGQAAETLPPLVLPPVVVGLKQPEN